MSDRYLPAIGSKWQHHTGNVYEVILLTNLYTERPDEYPVTVVYKGINGRVWSRPLAKWNLEYVG